MSVITLDIVYSTEYLLHEVYCVFLKFLKLITELKETLVAKTLMSDHSKQEVRVPAIFKYLLLAILSM